MTQLPGPFYHDFRRLGLMCEQLPGIFALNQQAKEPVITAYILLAIAKLRNRTAARVTFAELFCADGYYAMFARRFGADRSVGFDSDRDGFLEDAVHVRDLLGLDHVDFVRTDVHDIPAAPAYSIVANIGGLYHVSDPVAILDQSFRLASDYLIVQNVVSLATEDENYFETPAPGWTWGSRFSRQSFATLIRDRGWCVVDNEFNILHGNTRPEDRGSVYYLIDTARSRISQKV